VEEGTGNTACVGIAVQGTRGCPYVVVSDLKPVESGWLNMPDDLLPIVAGLRERFGRVAVGIDAPRSALANRRRW